MNHNTVFALIADLYSTIGVYRSQNKGNTWTLRNNSTEIVSYQGWYAKGLWIKSNDSTHLMFGGVNLFISTNNAISINNTTGNQYHSDIHDIVGNPKNSNKLYILTDGG